MVAPMCPDRPSVHCLPPSMFDMGGSNLHYFLGAEDEDLDRDIQLSDSLSYSRYVNQPPFVDFHTSQTDYFSGSFDPNKPVEAMFTLSADSATSFKDWTKHDFDSPSSATTTPTNTPTFPQSIVALPFARTEAINNDEISPKHDVSPQAFQPPKSISPQNLYPKRPCSLQVDIEAPTLNQPGARKRGRPRLNRTVSGSSANCGKSDEKPHKTRIPHTEVERKYRRGLNSELERLRCVVPTLPQIYYGTALGRTRLSKAMVLSAAIDYIKRTEIERDAAMDELDRLRCE